MAEPHLLSLDIAGSLGSIPSTADDIPWVGPHDQVGCSVKTHPQRGLVSENTQNTDTLKNLTKHGLKMQKLIHKSITRNYTL